MTSARKIAANRRNSRKSCGPRTAAGKAIASRNALRHGFSAAIQRPRQPAGEIERFAKALCGDDRDPELFDQALDIAGNEQALRSIRAQRIAAIERLRDKGAIALANGNNALAMMKAVAKVELSDAVFDEIALMWQRLHKHHEDQPAGFHENDEEEEEPILDLDLANKQIDERDEVEAVQEAVRDLIRLDRYERRTWSRQKRAIREFTNLKLMRALSNAVSSDRACKRSTHESEQQTK
jgi:hypothetical protein